MYCVPMALSSPVMLCLSGAVGGRTSRVVRVASVYFGCHMRGFPYRFDVRGFTCGITITLAVVFEHIPVW